MPETIVVTFLDALDPATQDSNRDSNPGAPGHPTTDKLGGGTIRAQASIGDSSASSTAGRYVTGEAIN
jgi:hypothetical protein